MSKAEILSDRVEKFDFRVQVQDGETLTSPVYRLVVDVSYGRSMGLFQKGYYIKINDSVYYIPKKTIELMTNTQTDRVLEFLKRKQAEFTIDIYSDKTISGHQYIQVNDVDFNSELYTLRDFKVFKGLWQEIEGELYENKYSPSIARFTSGRLIWYAKLMPEHSLQFTQVTTISVKFFDSQGHLEIFKIIANEPYAFPSYLYSERRKMTFFNHIIEGDSYVIPLGSERRIINISQETQIASPDHETVVLQPGEYLLFHPRPRDAVD